MRQILDLAGPRKQRDEFRYLCVAGEQPGPDAPRYLHIVPGRGYRYLPEG